MSKIEDGGYAFPCGPDDKAGWSAEYGMSLRDWFAGQALAGCFSGNDWLDEVFRQKEVLAAHAYEIADAMLVARKGGAA